MHYLILILILILIFTIIYYTIKKSKFIYNNYILLSPLYSFKGDTTIKILTYNVQRLPHLFRKNINIHNLLLKHDMVCLQENYCSLFATNRKNYGYNCIIPGGSLLKLVDSGLSVFSKFYIEFVDFVRFNNLTSVDRLSDKGFLVFKINDIYIVNTHLQSTYRNVDPHIAKNQLSNIINYCDQFDRVLICGDFNICLLDFNIAGYNKIISDKPTHWNLLNGIVDTSSKTEISDKYKPFYFDGGFYKNIMIKNINTQDYIHDTDHFGVSFEIII